MSTLITPYATVTLTLPVRYTPENIVNLPDLQCTQFVTALQLPSSACPRFQLLSILNKNGQIDGLDARLLQAPYRLLLDAPMPIFNTIFAPLGLKFDHHPRWMMINFLLSVSAQLSDTLAEPSLMSDYEQFNGVPGLPSPILDTPPILDISASETVTSSETSDVSTVFSQVDTFTFTPSKTVVTSIDKIAYPLTRALSNETIASLRMNIHETLAARYGAHLPHLSTDLIRDTCYLIDEKFFHHYIRDTMAKKKYTLDYRLFKGTSTAGRMEQKQGTHFNIVMSRPIFTKLFTQGEKSVKSNGIKASTKLGAWIIVIEHEMTHLLMRITSSMSKNRGKAYSSHGACFKSLVDSFFRHGGIHHNLGDGDADVLAQKEVQREVDQARIISERRANLRIGDRVRVEFRDGTVERTVVKLNPKTVGVTHTNDVRNAKGRLAHVNVPYQFVHKI